MKIIRKFIENVCVIGDIHSSPKQLKEVIAIANSKGIDSFIFLGDLVDRGVDPNEVIDIVHELVTIGKALVLIGNHDMKFIKYFSKVNVTMNSQQQETLKLLKDDRIPKFLEIFSEELVAIYDPKNKTMLSHAAAGRPLNLLRHLLDDVNKDRSFEKLTLEDMFSTVPSIVLPKKRVGNFLYGITNGDTEDGFPVRLPITKQVDDDLDGWLYAHGHIHAGQLFPENGNKKVLCLDFSCGELGGNLVGIVFKDGKPSFDDVIYSSAFDGT